MTLRLCGALVLFGFSVFGACSAPGTHSASSNFTTDLWGVVDTRPATWGRTASVLHRITFRPPSGCRVRVMRVYGDFSISLRGPQPTGSGAWGLWGLQSTAPEGSQWADWAADNTMLYVQLPLSAQNPTARAPVDYDVSNGGLLGPDNVLVSKLASFLNDTNSSVHAEPSFTVVFRFE